MAPSVNEKSEAEKARLEAEKAESAKAVAASIVAQKMAAAQAAAARVENDRYIRKPDPLPTPKAQPAAAARPKKQSSSLLLAAAGLLIVAGLGATQGFAWLGMNETAEQQQPAQQPVQLASSTQPVATPTRPAAPIAKPAARESVTAAVKSAAPTKPKPKPQPAPAPAVAPMPVSAPAATVVKSAPEPVAEAPKVVATVAAAPTGKFFERNEVDVSPQVATRVEPNVADLKDKDLVVVRVLVSQTGHPYRVSLLRGSKKGRQLDDAVVAAVNQWTFSPAVKRGEAVSCWFNIGVPLGRN